MRIKRKAWVKVWFGVAIVAIFCLRKPIAKELCRIEARKVVRQLDLVENSSSILFASTRGDGSEMVIKTLPDSIRPSFERMVTITKLIVGPDSRIYFRYRTKEAAALRDDNYQFVVSTYRMWKDSPFYFGDIEYHFFPVSPGDKQSESATVKSMNPSL